MNNEKKDLFPENEEQGGDLLNPSSAADAQDDKATESNKDAAEENEQEAQKEWQFDAQAPTVSGDILEGREFEIDSDQLKVERKSSPSPNNESDGGKNIVIKKDKLIFVTVGVISAVVVAVLVFFGVRYYTVPNGKEGALMNPVSVAAEIGDTKVSLGMFNYYYAAVVSNYETYANYGYYDLDTTKDYATQYTTDEDGNQITWLEFFEKTAMAEIENYVTYYNAGIDAGMTLTDKQKEAIDSQIDYFKEAASEQSLSLDQYLETALGKYCTEETVRTMLEHIFISSAYKGITKDGMEITDENIDAYFDEHKEDYYQINYCRVSVEYDTTDDETKQASDELIKSYMSRIKDRESLVELLPEIYKDFIDQQVTSSMESDSSLTEAEARESAIETCEQNIDAVLNGSDTPFDESINDWLFSDDTAIGSVNYYVDSDTGYAYIFLKTENPVLMEDNTYSVRHILIQPEASSDEAAQSGEYTDEQWAAAEEETNKVLDEYNSGEKTEAAFALLAEKYSDDVGSTSSGSYGSYGGLYEGVTAGEMVTEFEDWAFDEGRKYGDVEIVKSQYGYHIMYFVNQLPQYKAQIIASIKDERLEEAVKDIKVKVRTSVVSKAIDDFYADRSSSSSSATAAE